MTARAFRREAVPGDLWNAPGAGLVRGRHVHFMGIGGIGMSALAHLARAAGAVVSGCDVKLNDIAASFVRAGCRISRGHSPEHLDGIDLLVRTAATRATDPEIVAAHAKGIPVFDRLPMTLRLAEGMKLLGVAGSHGKTTTTALAASVLIEAGLDPSCVVGGVVDTIGSNARAGSGDWFVAEIDESDGYIARAACEVAILTNVDREHLDHYAGFGDVCRAFGAFLSNVPAEAGRGLVVACADSAPALALARASGRRVATYGLSSPAEFRAERVRCGAEGSRFDAITPSGRIADLYLSRTGVHNVQNALAVVAAAAEIEIGEDAIRRAFARAPNVGRRWERHDLPGGVRMIVDYAHHPAEVAATVAAARLGAAGRLVAFFQPHRYTRTEHLGEEFGPAFAGEMPRNLRACGGPCAGVDGLVVMPIYAASEDPVPGVTAEIVAGSARRAGVRSVRYVESRDEALEALEALARTLREGDTLLVLGAGDVNTLGEELHDRL